MTELIRRHKNTNPVLKRRKRPVLVKRSRPILVKRKRPILKRRPKPDVYYCARKKIKNRLPYPIECSWIGTMHLCCRECTKKVNYVAWKEGEYSAIEKELKDRTYKPINGETTILLRRNHQIEKTEITGD